MKLEQGPFRVTLTYDGQEALDTLHRESDVGLVLLDLMMPRLTGLDVLAAMRDDERYRALPCVILTAAGEERQYQRAMSLGASDFMTKPFSPKRLLQRAIELTGQAPQETAAGRIDGGGA